MDTILGIVVAITVGLWLLFGGFVILAVLGRVLLEDTDLEVPTEPTVARAGRWLMAAAIMTGVSIGLYVGMQIMGVCG